MNMRGDSFSLCESWGKQLFSLYELRLFVFKMDSNCTTGNQTVQKEMNQNKTW